MNTETLTARDPDGKEWTYYETKEQDGDQFWAPEYWGRDENGTLQHCDWSRFARYEDRHFEIYVKAGFPRRRTAGPWSPDQIDALGLEMDEAG